MDRPPQLLLYNHDFLLLLGCFLLFFFFLKQFSQKLAFASLKQSMSLMQPRQVAAVVAS